jgi:hypothetical protein
MNYIFELAALIMNDINANKIFRADEDDDSKWCICDHHIISHVEDGSLCDYTDCGCKRFVPCSILSSKECRNRRTLLKAVMYEYFDDRNIEIEWESLDRWDLLRFARKYMVYHNLNNIQELDAHLEMKEHKFSGLGHMLGNIIPAYYNVYLKSVRSYQPKLHKRFKELKKIEFEPKYNRIDWFIRKERNGTRLVAVSKKRVNGKQIRVHIGSGKYNNEEDYWVQYLEKLYNQAGIDTIGERWCHYGLTVKQSLEFYAIKSIAFHKNKFKKTDPVYLLAKEACDKLGVQLYGRIHEFVMDGELCRPPEKVRDIVIEYSSKISKLLKNREWYNNERKWILRDLKSSIVNSED